MVYGWDFSYTPSDKLRNVKEFFESNKVDSKEIKFNQNMMIPLPGTTQDGFKVEMI